MAVHACKRLREERMALGIQQCGRERSGHG